MRFHVSNRPFRRIPALCLCTALLFSLMGCTVSHPAEKTPVEVPEIPVNEVSIPSAAGPEEHDSGEAPILPEPTEDAEQAAALAALLREELPRMDGSTSAIPLEAAIRSGIFGISREEAQESVRHSTSHDAFYHLLNRDCSLAFSHLLSPEQYQLAAERGIRVEMVPIAREGFVFLVSAENPVESLTSDEIRQIYTGQIRNWSEVGGPDMPITAYQRNTDSGSQNYMRAFMGDLPLTDAPTALRPGNMDTLVDCVATYDGEKNGIGYSVFSYVGGMYDAAGGVKLLKIDGVEPTYETICDGSYPCTGYNYAVIRASEAEDSPARNLIAWTLSSAGQRAISATGYFAPLLPSSGIGISIPDLHLMTDVGTGKADCTPADWCYYLRLPERQYESGYPDGKLRVRVENTPFTDVFDYTGNIPLPETGKAALDAQITAFASDAFASLTEECLRAFSGSDPASQFLYSDEQVFYPYSRFACVNGYLSVSVGIRTYGLIEIRPEASAMWDLETGTRLTLSDLFRKDAAFVPMLNSAVRRCVETEPGYLYIEMPREVSAFEGLPEGFDCFGIALARELETPEHESGLSFFLGLHPDNNPYFAGDVIVPVSVRGNDLCLLSEPRSLGGAFGEERQVLWDYRLGTLQRAEIPLTGGSFGEPYTWSAEYRWTELEGFPGAERINEAQRAYREKHSDPGAEIWTDEFVHRVGTEMADILKWNLGLENPTAEQLGTARVILEETVCPLGSRYAAVSCQMRVEHMDWIGFGGGVCLDPMCAVYDLETGEAVPFSEIFPQPYAGEWISVPPELPDSGLLGDPVKVENSSDPGALLLTFEPAPGERYVLELLQETLNIFNAS